MTSGFKTFIHDLLNDATVQKSMEAQLTYSSSTDIWNIFTGLFDVRIFVNMDTIEDMCSLSFSNGDYDIRSTGFITTKQMDTFLSFILLFSHFWIFSANKDKSEQSDTIFSEAIYREIALYRYSGIPDEQVLPVLVLDIFDVYCTTL